MARSAERNKEIIDGMPDDYLIDVASTCSDRGVALAAEMHLRARYPVAGEGGSMAEQTCSHLAGLVRTSDNWSGEPHWWECMECEQKFDLRPAAQPEAAPAQVANIRPPFESFKRPTCKGSLLLGSACGHCERCEWEKQQLTTRSSEPTSSSAPQIPAEDDLTEAIEWWKQGSTTPEEAFSKDGLRRFVNALIAENATLRKPTSSSAPPIVTTTEHPPRIPSSRFLLEQHDDCSGCGCACHDVGARPVSSAPQIPADLHTEEQEVAGVSGQCICERCVDVVVNQLEVHGHSQSTWVVERLRHALSRAEAALAAERERTREEDCKAACFYCRQGTLMSQEASLWNQHNLGTATNPDYVYCKAAAIRALSRTKPEAQK